MILIKKNNCRFKSKSKYKRIKQFLCFQINDPVQNENLLIQMQIQAKQSQQMVSQSKSQDQNGSLSNKASTLGSLIDSIQFSKKKTKMIKKSNFSDTSSMSSHQSIQSKQKSKLWTQEQNQKFLFLLKKHGPDFQLLGKFFQKKSKNQLKNKYKQYLINQKKKAKKQDNNLKAISLLFKQVDEKQQQN